MIPVRSQRLVGSAFLCGLASAILLGCGSDPTHPETQNKKARVCSNCQAYDFVVGRPAAVVRDGEQGHVEGNFFVIKMPNNPPSTRYYGYAVANNRTIRFAGPAVDKLKYVSDQVIAHKNKGNDKRYCEPSSPSQSWTDTFLNWQPHFRDCGIWLRYAEWNGSVIQGFYHAETDCCYGLENNRQTYASTGLAKSTNGLLFDKQVTSGPLLPQNITPQIRKGIKGLDQASALRVGDYYYLYFGFRGNGVTRKPAVARVHHSQFANRSQWQKYEDGAFRSLDYGERGVYYGVETLNSGVTNTNYHGVSPGYDQSRQLFYLVGPKSDGVYLSLSDNATSFYRLEDPLFPNAERSNKSGEQFGNVSMVGPNGRNQFDGNMFHLFYRYVRAEGAPEDGRNLVRRRVWVKTREHPTEPRVTIIIGLYRNPTHEKTWTTTKLPLRGYQHQKNIGRLFTRQLPNTVKLVDCERQTPATSYKRDHLVRVGQCQADERTEGVMGFVYKSTLSPQPSNTIALYRCYDEDPTTRDFIVGGWAECKDRPGRKKIGYMLKP